MGDMYVSSVDYDDMTSDNADGRGELWLDREANANNPVSHDQYHYPGSFLETQSFLKFTRRMLEESFNNVCQSPVANLTQNFLSRLDRHGVSIAPLNTLNYGYTFITRPRLNMTEGNLRQHPITATLMSNEPNSVPFMIRALLDTKLCNGIPDFRGKYSTTSGSNDELIAFRDNAIASGLVEPLNPFFTPLCNGLKGISGFPDFNLETETTDGDFHCGDFTFVKGSDMNNRTQELSLEFKDVQGSVILSCIYYWCLVMALQAKGVLIAYQDDIYEQRLNYTVSIYRFVTDTSRKNILWWAKATGCYPKSAPVGSLFNINQGEVTLSSAMNFSVPFVANDVKANDPGALMDFNRLMERYTQGTIKTTMQEVPSFESNFDALPYIVTGPTGMELSWRTSSDFQIVTEQSSEDLTQLQQNALGARKNI